MLTCCCRLAALWLVPLVLTGCGGDSVEGLGLDLAPVTGTVTLDGEPLAGATVASVALPPSTGTPPALGAPSWGVTDAEGRFALKYRGRVPGAVVGPCEIRINKAPKETSSGGLSTLGPETIPARYNTNTTLKETVKGGQPNEFTFELTSGPKRR